MEVQHNLNRFLNTENWSFTENDEKAESTLTKFQLSARKQMPQGPLGIYSAFVMTHYDEMIKNKLYLLMKTIPKGVLHHCHISCCQDKQYYRRFILNDPIIYLTHDLTSFRIGTKKQSKRQKWVSMEQLKTQFKDENQMINFLSNITMFSKEDNRKAATKQIIFWNLFQKKVAAFFPIRFSLNHFKSYMKYICQKFIQNGYDRLQFRSMISELIEYDKQGNIVKAHPDRKYTQILDEIQNEFKEKYSNFSLGVIFFGLRQFNDQQNQQFFTRICQLNWSKTLGFDFTQQEDAYGSLESYDAVASKVLEKYPHLNYKKVYHAGQTKNIQNDNIQIAIRNGSVRIGHGANILQRMEFLPQCKNVCFQINPISNILTGLRDDTRISHAPVLMSLGYPLTINCDDPGKFGYEDSTVDYFSSIISFNWSLKDLKLLGIYSINHAICSLNQKQGLLKSFNQRWDQWVRQFIYSNY